MHKASLWSIIEIIKRLAKIKPKLSKILRATLLNLWSIAFTSLNNTV